MAALGNTLDHEIICLTEGCGKQLQGLAATGGLGPFFRQFHCVRCKEWWTLVLCVTWRLHEGIDVTEMGMVPTKGRDEGSVREALLSVPGVTVDMAEMMIEVARKTRTRRRGSPPGTPSAASRPLPAHQSPHQPPRPPRRAFLGRPRTD
jgi:hypothetical protein